MAMEPALGSRDFPAGGRGRAAVGAARRPAPPIILLVGSLLSPARAWGGCSNGARAKMAARRHQLEIYGGSPEKPETALYALLA